MSNNHHQSCPLCHGPYPDDLVRKIKSAKVGKPMTADEFMVWLSVVGPPPFVSFS